MMADSGDVLANPRITITTWSAVGWGRLDGLPNSLKRLWRWLMVEKWTFNSRVTALVDILAVIIPIARSVKTCDICGIVLCDNIYITFTFSHLADAFIQATYNWGIHKAINLEEANIHIKLHILEWPFIVASPRHTCAIIMLSNQHLGMPHLWGGWIISAK